MKRFALFSLILLVLAGGCGGKGSSKAPTAPQPPDNLVAPALTCSANWSASPPTLTLTAPAENLVATSSSLTVSHPPNGGGVFLVTDLQNGTTLTAAAPLPVHVSGYRDTGAPYVWQQGDDHVFHVTVRRVGQSTYFILEVLRD